MIQTITRREYMVCCDGCGDQAAAKATPEQAFHGARASGWESVTTPCALASLTTWLCPRCQDRREKVA
jgi:hypothetical protein